MPLPLSHIRQHLSTFTTPRIADYVVTQIVDVQRSKNADGILVFPEKGDPHPDSRFPNHRFAHAEKASDDGQKYFFHYIAEREEQDNYNFEFTEADIGGTKFNAVKREYLILREDFDESTPAMGSAMPDPTSAFNGSYVMSERRQVRSSDPIVDSIFLVDQRVYVKRCTQTTISTDKELGIGVAKSTTLYYRGESVGGTPVEDLFADQTDPFWGAQSDGTEVDGQQLSCNWFAVIVTSSRDDALSDFKLAIPTSTNLNLPDVLQSITAVWNEAGGNGDFTSDWEGEAVGETHLSLSGSESASAESSASIQGDLIIDIKRPLGRNIPSTSYFFYLKLTTADTVTSAEFLAKVSALVGHSVSYWPSFNPVTHTIVIKGQKVAVSAKASASASLSVDGDLPDTVKNYSHDKNEGTGDSYDCATMNQTVQIPPTIHGIINIAGDLTKTATAAATCDVGWTGTGTPIAFPSTTASATASLAASGAITPTSLAATTPAAIPSTGYYIVESRIDPYESQWVKCYAEVINAANL